jgi:small GTP-binding protein
LGQFFATIKDCDVQKVARASMYVQAQLEQNPTLKIVLAGDTGAGKTSLVHSLIQQRFISNLHATVGPCVTDWTCHMGSQAFDVKLWDTAGQERYRSLTPVYFRDAAAGVIVADVTEEDPKSQIEQWIATFRQAAPHQAPIVVAGNKSDLVEDRQGLLGWGNALKTSLNVDFILVSAKSGDGVMELFTLAAQKAAERGGVVTRQPSLEQNDSVCMC